MADLENLLLEAAGRTTASGSRSRMQTKRSYSDEPSYSKSSSEDEDSDDPGFASRKPSGSQIPLKKRFDAAEKDDERGNRDEDHIDDDDSGHDSDSDSVGSDLYKDDDDREKLSKMTELEREMILADRAESRDDILKKKKAGAWQGDKKNRPTKEAAPPPSRGRASTAKPGRSEYKDALVELAARRKAQDASNQRKKRDFTSGSSRYSPKRKAMTSSPISDSPPGRGRSKGGSSISSDSEGSSNESEKASADDDSSGGHNLVESDDDGHTDKETATFEDIKGITVRRSRLLKWFMEPFFEDAIVGCFVRVGIGMSKTGRSIYRLCLVRNVDASDPDRQYKFENKTTHKYLNCVWGNENAAARWQMARVSDSPPLDEEFSELLREIERHGGHMPSKTNVLEKREAIQKLSNFVYSAATVKQMLQEKKSASIRPLNIAAEKDRLRKEMDIAQSKGDHDEVERIRGRLQELEAMSRQVKDKDSKAMKLAEMNRKNRVENFKNASELKPVNTSLKAGEAGYDPFSRRWTRSRNYYVSKPAEEDDLKVPTAVSGHDRDKAGEVATAAALEAAAGAGKLVDTNAPVDAGTELHMLHDFDLPISLSGLQKFNGPQGAFLAFMAKKQRLEATIGVKIPENDGRRHTLTLTVSDYKRRRGLL
ncbi:protein RTF1 homolog [Nymphaea colorata]|nr:protein RTF1 homolog [Nymphaea colorata]